MDTCEAKDWGLTFDRSKEKWKFRPTIDRGRKKVGKRITVALSSCVTLEDAMIARDAAVSTLEKVGLRVVCQPWRRPRREGGQSAGSPAEESGQMMPA